MHENRTMKPVDIVLRRGRENKGEKEGVNLIKIYCKHLCKYPNVAPVQLIC
jgi:hypothetical protein